MGIDEYSDLIADSNMVRGTIGIRRDYPVIIVIVGIVVLTASLLSGAGNDFAFFIINPLTVALIGIGVVLTVKRNNDSIRQRGLSRYQRFVLFAVAMLLLAFFAYVVTTIIRVTI